MLASHADPAAEFIIREMADDERLAALLSRADGRAVDNFGFVARAKGWVEDACERRTPNHDGRKRRLQIARWWAQGRREWEAKVAECRRRGCQEFAVVVSGRNWSQAPHDLGRGPKRVVCLLVTAVNLTPLSDRGELKNGLEVAFEIQAGAKPGFEAADGRAPRRFQETFAWPSRSLSDGGAFASRRLARLGLATGVIGPDAPGKVVAVGWQQMTGRRLAAAIRRETLAGDDGEIVRAQVDGLRMWPVGVPVDG